MTNKQIARFFEQIEKTDSCWDWTGYKDKNGYGRMKINSKSTYVHRISYYLFVDLLDSKLCIDHMCFNRSCVNPSHLRQITFSENSSIKNKHSPRKLRENCKRGHIYSGHNLYTKPQGQRCCRKCMAINQTKWRNKITNKSIT